MPKDSTINSLRILAVAAVIGLSAMSTANAETGEGDSALRAALHDPRLIEQQRAGNVEQYSIGDPSLGYAQRQRANRPASAYTRYRP